MNKQKNKTVSFVVIMIAAASITGLMAPSLGIDVQAENDEDEYESSYNDNKQESSYNDNKQESNYNDNKQESSYNGNYANNEYAKYYDPKDKDVKIEVIKCDNSITNIFTPDAASSQNQEPSNIGVIGGFEVQGDEQETAAASATNGMNGMDGDKLAQLSIDKNTIVVCWSNNENNQDNNQNLPVTQTNDQRANTVED